MASVSVTGLPKPLLAQLRENHNRLASWRYFGKTCCLQVNLAAARSDIRAQSLKSHQFAQIMYEAMSFQFWKFTHLEKNRYVS